MNTYRVIFRIGTRRRAYDVDASHPAVAIRRALDGFSQPHVPDVDVWCRLLASNVKRHYSDPKVREA